MIALLIRITTTIGLALLWTVVWLLYVLAFWLSVAMDGLHRKLDDLCDRILRI